jgi:transcriptional regulator with GAF, ATPase, and Fis domain
MDAIINRSLMDMASLLGADKACLYLPATGKEKCLACAYQLADGSRDDALQNSILTGEIPYILKNLHKKNIIRFHPDIPRSGEFSEYEEALTETTGPFSLFITSGFSSTSSNDLPVLLIFGSTSKSPGLNNHKLSPFLILSAQVFYNAAIHHQVLVDRDKLLGFEKFISEISKKFINISADQIDEKITQTLEKLTLLFGIDRTDVFKFKNSTDELILTHIWAREGHLPKDAVISAKLWPYLSTNYLPKGKVVYCDDVEHLPEIAHRDKESFRHFGTKSFCAIPLMVDEQILGVLTMDTVGKKISWPKEIIERVSVIGEILASALARKAVEEKLLGSYEEIKILKDRLEHENAYFKDEIKVEHNFEEIIGNSDELKYVLFKIEQVAETDTTAVILGETGTGKELVARAIHEKSGRKNRPFIKIDCGTLPASIIERELFGHERGTFTGADRKSIGRIEVADGGTLFLDEIGELPLELQPKILRVIQDREFERLGNPSPIKVDVRIIAASNRDLEAEAKKNTFRKDLWYRLSVFPITIPPLRDRKEDIPLLVNFFVNKFALKMSRKINKIPMETMKYLTMQEWPGNIRELQNTIERAVIVSKSGTLTLAEKIDNEMKCKMHHEAAGKTLSEVERSHLYRILEEANWRIYGPGGAARILDLNPSTLRFRIKKLGIEKPEHIRKRS